MKYVAVSLLAMFALASCQKDETLKTTDVGPTMEVLSYDTGGYYGGKIGFEVTLTDRLPLSTLKAQVFFDDQLVAEEVIRVKTNGTYDGAVTLPYYKDIPDGEAVLRIVSQNIQFGLTSEEFAIDVARPEPAYLTFMLGEQEFRMDPTGEPYEYAVTDTFPQKPKGYITTAVLDDYESVVNFGYENGGIVADSTEPIPFSNSNAGEFTITFNIKTFEAAPFTKLLFDGTEMTMVDSNNYTYVTTLTQGQTYELTGISDFADWNVDMDFFERPDELTPEQIKFLPMTGMYKVTANFKYQYLKIEAMKTATALATLEADATGNALWVIGDANFGKPTIKNGAAWNPEAGGLCMARVADKKFQITLVAGISLNASSMNIKFFWQKTWDHGEFFSVAPTGDKIYGLISTESDTFKLSNDGNVELVTGKTLDLGGVYRFTVDVTGGIMAAVLTVEKIGTQPLPPADIKINGTAMTMVDVDNYKIDVDLTQGGAVTMSGADAFTPAWINPDFFAVSGSAVTLAPLSGKYRILLNRATKVIDALPLKSDGSGLLTMGDDGHGAIYFIGYGIGSPTTSNQPAWTTEKGICVPEFTSGIYKMTAQAGPDNSTVLGQRFRVSGWSGKFFAERGWGGLGAFTLAAGTEAYLKIAGDGNIESATGVELTAGDTYELTVDCTAGKSSPVVTFIKK